MLSARVFHPEKVEPVLVKPFVVRAVAVLALWAAVAPPSEVLPRKVTVWVPESFITDPPPKVTAPVSAMSCPLTIVAAPVSIETAAIRWPTIVEEAPSVAEHPICKKTLHAWAPLVRTT